MSSSKKRKYEKKSDYWKKFDKPEQISPTGKTDLVEPVLCGDNYYTSNASNPGEKPQLFESKSSCNTVTDALRGADRSTT